MIQERLLHLPLFLGMSSVDLTTMLEEARFNFLKRAPGGLITEQGDTCKSLYFVIEGKVMTRFRNKQYAYELIEWNNARNMLLQPECLFGLHPFYIREFRAETSCQLLELLKDDVRDILLKYPVFRINFLNLLSTLRQQNITLMKRLPLQTLEQRLYYFFMDRIQWRYGRKLLKIKMTDMANYLLTPRINVSNLLHELEERKILTMHRGAIEITDFSSWSV